MKKKVTAIILVAGNSTRFGQNRNKNFELIDGKSILSYSIRAFLNNNLVNDIVIAIRKEDEEIVQDIVGKERCNNIKIVLGGKTRQESVYNAINYANADIVIIHDGARPLIKDEYITNSIMAMNEYKGVTIGVKSKDTIKITNEDGIVLNSTVRSNTWIIQTPQCFDRKILKGLHEKYKDDLVTDDCMLLEKEGYKVKVIEGDYTNIKVTTFEDIQLVKAFLYEE